MFGECKPAQFRAEALLASIPSIPVIRYPGHLLTHTMKDLSQVLIELYEAAENAPINSFPREAARLIRKLVQFDGAVIGMAESGSANESDLIAGHVLVYDGESEIATDQKCIADQDENIGHLIDNLDHPLRCDGSALLGARPLPAMEAFVRKHGLRKLMLYGTTNEASRRHWIVMYRRSENGYTEQESKELSTLWPHIERSIAMNRVRHLERQLRTHESRAAALVTRQGHIEAADIRFRELLANECPSSSPNKLPDHVLRRFRDGSNFEGERILISPYFHTDFIVCKAYEKNLLGTLTRAELAVAKHFSCGLTHKDVALKLGVSQNTVRTHIKHVYDKLSIHSKVRLAQLMGTDRMQ